MIAVGADLNRDFPSPFLTCKGQQPESCDPAKLSLKSNRNVQPETAAIMAWSSNDSFPFTAAANLHEGAVVVSTEAPRAAGAASNIVLPLKGALHDTCVAQGGRLGVVYTGVTQLR